MVVYLESPDKHQYYLQTDPATTAEGRNNYGHNRAYTVKSGLDR